MIRKTLWGAVLCFFANNSLADTGKTEIGIGLGTPSGINFVMKKDINNVPFQFSGFYLGELYGAEAGFSFYKNENSQFRSAQLVAGSIHYDEKRNRAYYSSSNILTERYVDKQEWNYIGVSSTFQFGGFYIEPGLSVGSGDYSTPQILLQFGWLWSL